MNVFLPMVEARRIYSWNNVTYLRDTGHRLQVVTKQHFDSQNDYIGSEQYQDTLDLIRSRSILLNDYMTSERLYVNPDNILFLSNPVYDSYEFVEIMMHPVEKDGTEYRIRVVESLEQIQELITACYLGLPFKTHLLKA